MISPVLLLAGIGMMIVAIASVIYWKIKTHVNRKYFFYGVCLWIIATFAKIFLDYTITEPLYYILVGSYPAASIMAIMGLYAGLRTGLFESGFTYIAVIKTKLKTLGFNEAVAIGIGFSFIEALVLGLLSFIGIIYFIMNPGLEAQLAEQQLQQLSNPFWIVIAPIIERASTIFIHVFASLLVIYAARVNKASYLFLSIIYKTLIDGMIPILAYIPQYMGFVDISNLIVEIPVMIVAAIGFLGIRWIKAYFITKPKIIVAAKKRRKAAKKRR